MGVELSNICHISNAWMCGVQTPMSLLIFIQIQQMTSVGTLIQGISNFSKFNTFVVYLKHDNT